MKREETRAERELRAMVAIIEGAAMDRFAQIFDCDDFSEEATDVLNWAIDAEASGEAGDWETARARANDFIGDLIADYGY